MISATRIIIPLANCRELRCESAFERCFACFVHQAHRFHQKPRGRAGRRCAIRGSAKIDLKLAVRPMDRLEHRGIAFQFPELRVLALPRGKIQVA